MTISSHVETERPRGDYPGLPWWSPLEACDVADALTRLGAEPLAGSGRWALVLGTDPLAPSLVLESVPAGRGTALRVCSLPLGFARDFALVVQGGLTVFAAWVALCASSLLAGAALTQALAAVGLAWACFMGLFAALRATAGKLSEDSQAFDQAWRQIRLALFAQER